jgi:DNA replication and repair protein RecF
VHLSTLIIENFRSYSRSDFIFDPKVNLIIGHNGSGKTNILEAIYFLSSGKSFRSTSLSQLINWNSPFTSVRGKVSKNSEPVELEAQLIKDSAKISLSRKFLIDQVVKTRPKYLGTLKTVIFEPEDIRLVTGSPTRRRDYLDSVFATTEWRYAQALSQYHRALKHRNELLDLIREGKNQRSELFYWDQSLIKNANLVHTYRLNFTKSVNSFFQNHPFSEIRSLSINYHPSILTQDKLNNNYSLDLNLGYTQAGIHRDDFSFDSDVFSASDKNLAFWGSRGQQRLAVLALRLGQINYLEETYSQKPVLLLDDIFSELDPEHRQLVVNICGKYQTIFTSAEDTTTSILPDAHTIHLSTAQT